MKKRLDAALLAALAMICVPASAQIVSFGDSVTAGVLTPNAANYPQITSIFKGEVLTNYAVSGAMAADQADQIYGISGGFSTAPKITYMIGANDERIYGTDANKLANYKSILSAEIYYLGSTVARATEPSWSFTGTWANNAPYTIGKASHTNGSTATVTFTGDVLLAGYIIQDGNAGQFLVTVDGVSKGTFNASGPAAIATYLGRTYAPALLRIAGNGAGSHTAVFTVVSPTGQYVYLDWISLGISSTMIFQSSITRQTAAGYAANGGSDANVAAFNSAIRSIVTQAQGDGINVTYVDASANFNPSTDAGSDGIHPTDLGQVKLAVPMTAAAGM